MCHRLRKLEKGGTVMNQVELPYVLKTILTIVMIAIIGTAACLWILYEFKDEFKKKDDDDKGDKQ